MNIKKIESRRKKISNSSEWQNFRDVVETSRWYFNPDVSNINGQTEEGARLNKRRVSVAGQLYLDNYANGIVSETVTNGQEWFGVEDEWKESDDADMFVDMSRIMLNRINHGNFYSQYYKDQKGAGCDGTSCFYVERVKGKLNHVCVPFGNFWFQEDFRGRPETVWVEKKISVGALASEFGEENLSEKSKRAYEKNPDQEVAIIYYCAPRKDYDPSKTGKKNKPYVLLTYEKEEEKELDEGGAELQKFMVYRVKTILNERLGRGPAIDAIGAAAAVERASKEYERGARLAGVPILGVGASLGQNGFRWSNQENASVLVYNDTGISGPPQALNPKVNPEFIMKYIERNDEQLRKMFYLDYFNPVMDKKNITAYQTKEIVSKSQQMVDQLTGPLVEERLDPYLRWVFILLGEAGEFKKWGSWPEIQAKMTGREKGQREPSGRINFVYKSKLANGQKRIKLMADFEFIEFIVQASQGIEDPVERKRLSARVKWENIPEKIQVGVNASADMLETPEKAEKEVEQFKQQLAQEQQMEQGVKMADAANKASDAGLMQGGQQRGMQ